MHAGTYHHVLCVQVALAVKCDCSQLDQLVGPGEEEGETAERDATEVSHTVPMRVKIITGM